MIYFDTDVLIHHLVYQEKEKHKIATKIFTKSLEKNTAIVSLLSLQEIAFVLSKLDFDELKNHTELKVVIL
jgi:predicted nucleic acid-binding protein